MDANISVKNLVNIVVTLSGLPFARGYSATSSSASRAWPSLLSVNLASCRSAKKTLPSSGGGSEKAETRIGDSGRRARPRAGHLLSKENCRQNASDRKKQGTSSL